MVGGKSGRAKAAAVAIALCLVPPVLIVAEITVSGEIGLGMSAIANASGFQPGAGDSSPANSSWGSAKLGVDSAATDAVKASARISITNANVLTLERAYVKARIADAIGGKSLRFSAGKAPLAWGRGFVFNAGDPVFGAVPASVGIGASEYRTATDWMATAYVPLGDFSFAEAAELPPVDRKTNRAGGRINLAPGWDFFNSAELGYLFEQDGIHRAYIALDGSLFFDYYGAISFTKNGDADKEPRVAASAGLFRSFSLARDVTLTVRAEGLAYPQYNREIAYASSQVGFGEELNVGIVGIFAGGTESSEDLAAIAKFAGTTSLAYLPAASGLAGITASWIPVKNITLSAAVLKRFEKGDYPKAEALASASATFKF
jgi:hypothetical protein